VAVGLVVLGLILLVRSSLERAKRIVLESIPVLIAAGILSLVAGTAIEAAGGRLSWVFLVLLPGYLGSAGALGGILANRLSTKVHLGLVEASLIPRGTARSDMGFTLALAAPIFVFLVLLAEGTALVFDGDSPGFAMLLAVVLSAGAVATIFVLGVAYYGTLAVVRFGLDPDNMGIPMVTAALDVVGALTLISAVSVWGVT
jgi:mgtE-like transporter